MVCNLSRLASFTQKNVFKVQVVVYSSSSFIFIWLDIPPTINPFIEVYLGSFQFGAILKMFALKRTVKTGHGVRENYSKISIFKNNIDSEYRNLKGPSQDG